MDPHTFRGLPITLLVAAAVYAAVLFSGLTEDVLDSGALDDFDGAISAIVDPLRSEPELTWFRWISAIAGGPAILAVLLVSSGFLLLLPNRTPILALWAVFSGAQLTTTLGKVVIGRPRPEPMYDVAALAAFPSGHATVVMAVYGFIAYLIGRGIGDPMARFHVAFAALLLVALVGLSRIVLNVHFASDVLGGYLVGIFWLLVGVILVEARDRTTGGSRS
ncbi:phosphatase PAP2 family protein [Neotabrizicola shimadae]|uniref:Phosphatase PAP2 family protein n=1 Tax=Neotabrizicola shimadae TaxID=2807096 RepID=A0A8G1EBU5_9RHOB|nr:phosphatase PAP2 family protein [Neotabrizicola shimadae]QYZ68413.1 phosphatase PAP2 family protein [Neotabrizicola shimadae]